MELQIIVKRPPCFELRMAQEGRAHHPVVSQSPWQETILAPINPQSPEPPGVYGDLSPWSGAPGVYGDLSLLCGSLCSQRNGFLVYRGTCPLRYTPGALLTKCLIAPGGNSRRRGGGGAGRAEPARGGVGWGETAAAGSNWPGAGRNKTQRTWGARGGEAPESCAGIRNGAKSLRSWATPGNIICM